MALIEKTAQSLDSIAIYGAGNSNDLDLQRLVENFRAVYLIDLDRESLEYGLRSQSILNNSSIHCYAPVDITGQLHRLEMYARLVGDNVDYHKLLRCVQKDPLPTILTKPCDVVVSCCVFSQIIDTLLSRGHLM